MAHRSVTASQFGSVSYDAVEEVDPMSGLANLADVMLVFACGLMLALVVYWNVDITPDLTEITESQEMTETEDLEEAQRTISSGQGYEEMGTVYRDPSTGKMYLMTEKGEGMAMRCMATRRRDRSRCVVAAVIAFGVLVTLALAGALLSGCTESGEQPSEETSIWDGKQVDTDWYNEDADSFDLSSAAQLAGLAKLVDEGVTFRDKTVNLRSNIDLAGHEWDPIGGMPAMNDGEFQGTFDGHNNSITGLYMVSPEGYRALFGVVSNGTLKNFFLQGEVKGRESSSGVACSATNENFSNIVCDVDIFSTNYYKNVSTAPLVGSYFADGPDQVFTIDRCVNNGCVEANNWEVGGLIGGIGLTEGTTVRMSNCANNGYLHIDMVGTEDDESIGGLVGTLAPYGNYEFIKCQNNADVYATDLKCVGGIVGYSATQNVKFTDCKNAGAVETGTLNEWAFASGILGACGQPNPVFEDCSNTGQLSTYNGHTFDISGGVDDAAK